MYTCSLITSVNRPQSPNPKGHWDVYLLSPPQSQNCNYIKISSSVCSLYKVRMRSFSDVYVSACACLCVRVQCWTWRGMCLCTVHSWSCWEPSPPAPRWFLCCCLSPVTWATRKKRKRTKSSLRDTRLSDCCWPRWKHASTRTPTASGWLPLVNTSHLFVCTETNARQHVSSSLIRDPLSPHEPDSWDSSFFVMCLYMFIHGVCAQLIMRDHIYCLSENNINHKQRTSSVLDN